MPVGKRVHDLPAAEGAARGLVAQDESVTTQREDRLGKHDLGPTGGARRQLGRAEDDDLAEHLRRPEMKSDAGVAGDGALRRRTNLDPRIEPARQASNARVGDDVPPAYVGPFDAREVHRDPLPVLGVRDRSAVHLEVPHPARLPAGQQVHRVALVDGACDRRPGDHDAVPMHHERPVDGQPEVAGRRRGRRSGEQALDLGAQRVQPRARQGRHRDDRRVVERRLEAEDLDLLAHGSDARDIDQVGLRDDEDAAPDPEEVEDV